MSAFLARVFGNVWGTVVMSVIPLIELKGGIVFALSVGLPFWEALLLAYAGSTAVFFLFFFLLRPLLDLLKRIKFVGKFADKVESYFTERADKTLKDRESRNKRGLDEKTLKKIFELKRRNSFLSVFCIKKDVDENELTLQKSEVDRVMWVDEQTLKDMIKNRNYHNYGEEYFNNLFSAVKDFSAAVAK